MTIKELNAATDYDLYIFPLSEEEHAIPVTAAHVTPLLLGCAGISDLKVYRFRIVPESTALLVFVDLPREIVKAIHNYNHNYYK